EWVIFRDLARAVDAERAAGLGCEDSAGVRAEIAEVVSFYDGIQHLRKSGDAFQYGGPHLCRDWQFPTADGRAHFHEVALPTRDSEPGWFAVSTRRGKQFNTLIYAATDPLTGAPRDAILMNP